MNGPPTRVQAPSCMRVCAAFLVVLTVVAAVPRARADGPRLPTPEASTAAPPPIVYVNGLSELRPLVSEDGELAARANDLERRRRRAATVGMVSIVGGLALVVLGVMSLKEPPESCMSGCVASTTEVTWPFIGGGFGLAITGGLAAYWMAPPRRALRGIIDPWNRRHPDRPIALQDLPCGDGERQCTDRPFPLPPEMVPASVVYNFRGRHGLGAQLRFGAFTTERLDRGLRHKKIEAHRSHYRKTLEHRFSFALRGEGRATAARCRDWAVEEGQVRWGSESSVTIGKVELRNDTLTTFSPEVADGGFQCDLLSADGAGVHIARGDDADPGFVLRQGPAELLRARSYRASAENVYWWDTTAGYRIDADGRPVAVVDLNESGRVALATGLDESTRMRVAALIMAIVLDADRFKARSLDDSLLNPFF